MFRQGKIIRFFVVFSTISVIFMALIVSLPRALLEKYTPEESEKIYEVYDYVIVGGGAAGSVLASRLSEIPCVSVLLLEAGPEPPPSTEIPAASLSGWFTDIDWQYKTVPQKFAGRLVENRELPYSTAKVLGGGTTLGDMIYIRGNKKNYDDWAYLGAKGWSFHDVFPYFQKIEDNKDEEYLRNGYHSAGGPVTLHKPWYYSSMKPVLHEALSDIGYPFVDSNGPSQTGIFDFQGTLRGKWRCSMAKAYLVPAEKRPNLDILLNAMVKMILIEDQTAYGVEFDYGGHSFRVRAKREVISSAGAINTPQLLMLSGIGPRSQLDIHDIPVKADLPVGKNLQDHPLVLVHFVHNMTSIIGKLVLGLPEYIAMGTGPYASQTFVNYFALLKDDEIRSSEDFPNYSLELGEMITTKLGLRYIGYTLESYLKYLAPYDFSPLFMCLVQQLQPRSRGSVTLRSKNVYDHPLIDPNYLADPRDVDDLVEGIKTCYRIGTSKAMEKIGSRPLETVVPGCENYVNDTDNYFRCQARSTTLAGHHPVGTAKMGDPADPTTVVDPELRVKYISNLRVVDASIMPLITSGNTIAPVIMIAEKASDMIKETIQCYGQTQYSEERKNVLLYTTKSHPILESFQSLFSGIKNWFLSYI